MASISLAADTHYMWLPFSSNVPGAPQTDTAVTQYGINVMMDSDDAQVTEFEVTVVSRLASDVIKTTVNRVQRKAKASGVQYSTLYSALLDTSPNFAILSIQVNALAGVSVTQPVAGKDYSQTGNN
jgi:hypothetical protein